MIFLSTSSLYNCLLLLILFYSTLLYSTLLYIFSELPHYIIVFSYSSCSLLFSTVHGVLHLVSPEAQGALLDAINEVFEPVVSQVIIICSIDIIVT